MGKSHVAARRKSNQTGRSSRRRKLQLESLESRHLLAGESVIAPIAASPTESGRGRTWNTEPVVTIGTTDQDFRTRRLWTPGILFPAPWPLHVAGNNSTRVSRIRNAPEVSTLTFDLGGTFDVDGMALWNSTEAGQTDRGFENTTLSYSTDGGNTFTGGDLLTWTQRTADESPNQGNTPTPPVAMFAPEVQALPSTVVGVTHIRMDVDNFSSEAIVMASEIRFLGEVDTGNIAEFDRRHVA